MSSKETSPALADKFQSISEGQNITRPICSIDVFDPKDDRQILLAQAEVSSPPVSITDLTISADPQEQKVPGFTDRIEAYVEQMAKGIAERLDLGTRHDEIVAVLQKAEEGIKRTDPVNAAAIYTELMKRIDSKETKFKGEDLNIKIDPRTQKTKYVSFIPGDLNKQAKIVAQLLDTNDQTSAYALFNEAIRNKPEAEESVFAIAVDAHEKDEPFDDITINFDKNNQAIGYKVNGRPTDHEMMAAEAAKEGKKAPKDGEAIPLKELLTDYKTSFGDAYARSKMAADDDPAKSKTLEEAIKRLERSISPIKVVFSSQAEGSFTPSTGVIRIYSKESATKQIESFVHEAYHATHRGYKALYMGDKISKDEFVRLQGNIETECYEASIKVHQELTSKMGSPVVLFPYKKDGQDHYVDLVELYDKKGKAGLFNFVMDTKSELAVDGKMVPFSYRDQFSSEYDRQYANNVLFDRNAKSVRDAYNKYPRWRELIDDGF